MDDVYEIGLLLDFYGQMLTPRQQEIMDMHYNNDLSLGEIAENLEISRQGVFDNIKRGKALLNGFEKKLGLTHKFSKQKKKAQEILEYLKSINKNNLKNEDHDKLSKIEEGINDIINSI